MVLCDNSFDNTLLLFQLDYLTSRDYQSQIKKLEKAINGEEREIEKLRDIEKAHLEVCTFAEI